MPIGSTNVYNPGDLILSTVSGSGTSFIETKIIAATSSFILFNSSGTLTSASLNSIVATTSSYVSGSTSIITNLTASNISASGTGSFGMVGIGTSSPGNKLSVISGSTRIASTALAGILYLGNDGNNIYLERDNSYDLSLVQNGDSNSALYLASAGSVYVSIDSNNNDTNKSFIVQNNATKAGTELFRVQENGNVGVGTSSPTAKLHIYNGSSHFEATSNGNAAIVAGLYALQIGPLHDRDSTAGSYYGGIAFNHLLNHNGVSTYNGAPQAWIGTRLQDTAGSERDYLVFATKPGTGTSGTGNDIPIERVCIDRDGNVGIGTTAPGALLEISSSTAASLLNVKGAGGNGILFVSGSGNVGIGTSSPVNKLHIQETGAGSFTGLRIGKGGDQIGDIAALVFQMSSNQTFELGGKIGTIRQGTLARSDMFFSVTMDDGSMREQLRMTNTGNVGIGTTSPVAKLEISSSTAASLLNIKGAGGNGLLFVSGSGAVGIGTTLPNAKLEIIHDSTAATPALYIKGGYVGTTIARFERIYGVTPTTTYVDINGSGGNAQLSIASAANTFALGVNTTTSAFEISDNSSIGTNTRLLIDVNGNVGIGTTVPTGSLHIQNSVANVPILNLGGGVAFNNVSDLYVLNSYNTASGVGFAAKVIGVNISGSLTDENIPVQRTVWSGVASATAIVLSSDDPGSGNQDNAFQIWTSNEGTSGSLLTQKFSLSSTGNVGIGTTSPGALLDVSGSSRHGYRAADTHQFTGSVSVSGSLNATASWANNVVSASYALTSSFATRAQTANALNALNTYTVAGLTSAYVDVDGAGTIPTTGIYRPSTKTLGLSADGTLIFKISNVSSPATSSIETGNFIVQTGNVGIGTTVPTARLHVSGSTIITGSLNVSANITCLSLTETSTEAVKYNILPLPSQLDNVLKLKPVSFNYKANDKHSIGLIAEEVAKIYPEFTSDNNDSISYGKITSVLIQSIKELKTIIDNQQKQIENLIDKLK